MNAARPLPFVPSVLKACALSAWLACALPFAAANSATNGAASGAASAAADAANPASVAASGSTSGWTLDRLMSTLAQKKSGQASFEETKYLAIATEPVKSTGTLSFVAPDLRRLAIAQGDPVFRKPVGESGPAALEDILGKTGLKIEEQDFSVVHGGIGKRIRRRRGRHRFQ